MPHFSEAGNDEIMCQVCGRPFDAVKEPPVWKPGTGNVCPTCVAKEAAPISLHEHCRQESGLTGAALTQYINRHYGHG